MNFLKIITLIIIATGSTSAKPIAELDGYFSSWENIPKIISSISEPHISSQLDQLHKLTRIKLGSPQSSLCLNEEEHKKYMLQTKIKWTQWWESTGKAVSIQKIDDAQIDLQAFQMAWDFLGMKESPPKSISPVWIPTTWTLYITYTNSDYFDREKETWIIDRQTSGASISKLRGDYNFSDKPFSAKWRVTLSEHHSFSIAQADQTLKAISYLHRYAPFQNKSVSNDKMGGLYYPHSTLLLRDGGNRILWNTEGYDFTKTRQRFVDGASGRSYYFLRTLFSDKTKFKTVLKPKSSQLAPYRKFLSLSKPYFSHTTSDIIQFFGENGTDKEIPSMLSWAKKQKEATNPEMDWKVCSHDFGTVAKVNIMNSTRWAIQSTLKAIKRLENRLNESRKTPLPSTVKKLAQYVSNMLILEKKEKEADIQQHPQPLRSLIKVDRHPNDSDLKHLSTAIQAIRDNPDPKLFMQLIKEIHEGTLSMRSILEHIIINDRNLLKLKPWESKQEATAINACIEALSLVNEGSKSYLVALLLRSFGGGKIEIQGKNGGQSIQVTNTKNGNSVTYGSASNPLPLLEAQKELRRLYLKSKK